MVFKLDLEQEIELNSALTILWTNNQSENVGIFFQKNLMSYIFTTQQPMTLEQLNEQFSKMTGLPSRKRKSDAHDDEVAKRYVFITKILFICFTLMHLVD